MIRINTPGSLFTVRERDVADTEVAKLVWSKLKKGKHDVEHSPNVVELVALLNGRPYFPLAVSSILSLLSPDEYATRRCVQSIEECDLTVECLDGSLLYPSRMLRERFNLFDDFLTEHPNATSVHVPYTKREVGYAVYGSNVAQLSTFYTCVCHLNPKSNTYWFLFNLRGMPSSKIVALGKMLTADEREALILYQSRLKYPDVPVPSREGATYSHSSPL